MAILKDFISQVTFEEVWNILASGKADMEEYRESCEGIFAELSETCPQENTAEMTIRFVIEEESPWVFYFEDEDNSQETEELTEDQGTLQVYGFVPGDEEGYAIGLKDADILVGLDIHPETIRDYTPQEIVAHCMAEMIYTATMASSAYGTDKDMAGGGLLASQSCMSEDITNVDLDALREQLGVLPKPEIDYKTKYGFLF